MGHSRWYFLSSAHSSFTLCRLFICYLRCECNNIKIIACHRKPRAFVEEQSLKDVMHYFSGQVINVGFCSLNPQSLGEEPGDLPQPVICVRVGGKKRPLECNLRHHQATPSGSAVASLPVLTRPINVHSRYQLLFFFTPLEVQAVVFVCESHRSVYTFPAH